MTHEEIEIMFPPSYGGNAQISDLRLALTKVSTDPSFNFDIGEHENLIFPFVLQPLVAMNEIFLFDEDESSSYGRQVTINQNKVFVGDYQNKRVQVFDLEGTLLFEITNTAGGFARTLYSRGDILVVGAQASSTAWIYDLDGNLITQIETPTGMTQFGKAVATDGDKIVVTALNDNTAWIFDADGNNPIEIPRPVIGSNHDGYGISAAVGHGKIVIGDKYANDNSGGGFIFDYDGNLLYSIPVLNPLGGWYDYLGQAVAINSTKILITEQQGVYSGTSTSSGTAWLMNHDGSDVQRILRSEEIEEGWAFGSDCALTEEYWYVGAFEWGDTGMVFFGKLSEVDDASKTVMSTPIYPPGGANGYGVCVDTQNNTLVVGHHFQSSAHILTIGPEEAPFISYHPLIEYSRNGSLITTTNRDYPEKGETGNYSVDLSVIATEMYNYDSAYVGKYGAVGNLAVSIGGNNAIPHSNAVVLGWGNKGPGTPESYGDRSGADIIGSRNTVFGNHSTIVGNFCSTEDYCTAIGASNVANDRSTLIGIGLVSGGYQSTILGNYNLGKSSSVFEVGDGGSNYARANVFEISEIGTANLPGCNVLDIVDPKDVVIKEYLLSAEFGNSLPTTDPGVTGQPWNNAGILSISA